MELTVVNAYILYCYNTPKKERMTHLEFALAVARALLDDAHLLPALQYQPPPAAADLPLRLTGRHFPEPAGGRPGCKVCSDRQLEIGSRHSGRVRCVRLLCVSVPALSVITL